MPTAPVWNTCAKSVHHCAATGCWEFRISSLIAHCGSHSIRNSRRYASENQPIGLDTRFNFPLYDYNTLREIDDYPCNQLDWGCLRIIYNNKKEKVSIAKKKQMEKMKMKEALSAAKQTKLWYPASRSQPQSITQKGPIATPGPLLEDNEPAYMRVTTRHKHVPSASTLIAGNVQQSTNLPSRNKPHLVTTQHGVGLVRMSSARKTTGNLNRVNALGSDVTTLPLLLDRWALDHSSHCD